MIRSSGFNSTLPNDKTQTLCSGFAESSKFARKKASLPKEIHDQPSALFVHPQFDASSSAREGERLFPESVFKLETQPAKYMNDVKRNWDGIGWIILGSAAGGFLSWLYSLVLKQPLCDSVLLALTCSILFGIVAGGAGVYVFKLVDKSVFARTFFIAVLFGFVWKPVVEAIPAYVKKTTLAFMESNAKEIAAKTTETSEQLKPQGNPQTLKSQIKTTSDEAVKAVAALPEVKGSSDTHRVVSDSAVTAIAALGEVAIKNNDPTVKKEATEALSRLGSAALSTQSYGVANAVSKSLDNVVYKSKDPAIQGQAWDIKQKIDALNAPATATSVPP